MAYTGTEIFNAAIAIGVAATKSGLQSHIRSKHKEVE